MVQNCWEFKGCGRQPGGEKVGELGVCVAASTQFIDGINNGKNAGRACWAIAGTLCGAHVQGSFALKLSNCMKCDFFKIVAREEGRSFVLTSKILEIVKTNQNEKFDEVAG